MGNFIEKFNFFTNIFILLILVFGGIIWADSNGVWNRAEDIRGGIFGGDEQLNTVNYTFINPVYFNESVNAKEYCDINGTNCKNIANIAGGGDSYWEKLENDTYYLNGSMIIKSYGVIPYTCNKTYEGGMFYLNVTKMIYFCDGTNWNEYRGPEGPTGSTGSTGPRGVRGFTGSAGLDCSVSGTCAQLCIGTDCKNAWPSGGGSPTWASITGKPAGFADGVDNIGTFVTSRVLFTNNDGVSKTYTCPAGQKVLSCNSWKSSQGDWICHTTINDNRCTYNYCPPLGGGQAWKTQIVCGGIS